MAELWELIDRNGAKTGMTHVRGSSEPIPDGMYHMASVIWVVRPDGRILMTKRHPTKDFGGYYENSGGAVKAGETPLEAARRELFEEVGIKAEPTELRHIETSFEGTFAVYTYLYLTEANDVKITLQPSEVTEYLWLTHDEIDGMKDEIVPVIYGRFKQHENEITGRGL